MIAKHKHEEIQEEVYRLISDTLEVNRMAISPEADLRLDLGADSLDLVELIVAFSRTFQSQVCDHEVANISTIGEIVTYLINTTQITNVDSEKNIV